MAHVVGSQRANISARDVITWKVRPMRRKPITGKQHAIFAYDLETTRIKKGTPTLKFITGYGENFKISQEIRTEKELLDILLDQFLLSRFNGARFVAWNGNKYDVYFVARAILLDSSLIIRPYLTSKNSLRGLKVIRKKEKNQKGKAESWEFLDGIAMTGIEKSLKNFLKVFAPSHEKLSIDWAKTEFDSQNVEHVAYAERDSEGLYHGMIKAESILKQHFGTGFNPTIGNTGIKILQSQMPEKVACWRPSEELEQTIRDYIMRGGYCYCVKRYEGPVWKYDLNQAYAAAMRDAKLPAGKSIKVFSYYPELPGIYEVTGKLPGNLIPLYIKNGKGVGTVVVEEIIDTWLTSQEVEQLQNEGYTLEIKNGYVWREFFSMTEYVDNLERQRMSAPGGPSGAEGLMLKAIGNNSYGKTVERLSGEELVMSLVQPEGFTQYAPEDETLNYIWAKSGTPGMREYHCPQIGAFITAHVRMVVRCAALLNPLAWLYADTDCLVFSEPIDLPCHPSKYGAWKVETNGEHYRIIGKKVYCQVNANAENAVKHAKGMNVSRLGDAAFKRWYAGRAPVQIQLHRKNFLRFLGDSNNMFETRKRCGEIKTPVKLPKHEKIVQSETQA